MTQPTATVPGAEPGRGTLILVLGILSVVMLGFVTGIPAWVMGHGDLKKIKAGVIAAAEEGLTKAGMILGIIGTAISGLVLAVVLIGIFLAVGLSVFSARSVEGQQRAIEADLHSLASDAMQFRVENGSFTGYEIPRRLKSNENADFNARIDSPDQITFSARSQKAKGSIKATLGSGGELTDWVYEGDFSNEERDSTDKKTISTQT